MRARLERLITKFPRIKPATSRYGFLSSDMFETGLTSAAFQIYLVSREQSSNSNSKIQLGYVSSGRFSHMTQSKLCRGR